AARPLQDLLVGLGAGGGGRAPRQPPLLGWASPRRARPTLGVLHGVPAAAAGAGPEPAPAGQAGPAARALAGRGAAAGVVRDVRPGRAARRGAAAAVAGALAAELAGPPVFA